MRAVLAKHILEVVADGVGVAEALTFAVCNRNQWVVGIILIGIVADDVGCQAIEALVVVVAVVIAKLGLYLEVLEDFPTERTGHVQALAILLTVVVGL